MSENKQDDSNYNEYLNDKTLLVKIHFNLVVFQADEHRDICVYSLVDEVSEANTEKMGGPDTSYRRLHY